MQGVPASRNDRLRTVMRGRLGALFTTVFFAAVRFFCAASAGGAENATSAIATAQKPAIQIFTRMTFLTMILEDVVYPLLAAAAPAISTRDGLRPFGAGMACLSYCNFMICLSHKQSLK
jgi:hypothetical protein